RITSGSGRCSRTSWKAVTSRTAPRHTSKSRRSRRQQRSARVDRPATAQSGDRAHGAELRVSYPAIRRFALRTALWTGLMVAPAAVVTFLVSQRSDSVYLSEATVLAPLTTFD